MNKAAIERKKQNGQDDKPILSNHALKIIADQKNKKKGGKRTKKILSSGPKIGTIDKIVKWNFYHLKTNQDIFLYTIGGPNKQLYYFNLIDTSYAKKGQVLIFPQKYIYSLIKTTKSKFVHDYSESKYKLDYECQFEVIKKLDIFLSYVHKKDKRVFNNLKSKPRTRKLKDTFQKRAIENIKRKNSTN